MELYNVNPGEENSTAERTQNVLIFGSREELLKICEFFAKAKEYLEENPDSPFHMHLQDNFDGWNDKIHFDIELNKLETPAEKGYSLKCDYYSACFPTRDALLDNIRLSGMDPNYEITKDGVGTGETAWDLIGEEE